MTVACHDSRPVITSAVAPLITLLAAASGSATAWDRAGMEMAQSSVIVRQRVIVRVPLPEADKTAVPRRWREKKGPRCVRMRDVAGAAIAGEDVVDIIFRGGLRIRAELGNSCPALTFYNGFYIRPGIDGRVCADRDAIHARSGAACEIDRFRKLVPSGASQRRP